MKPIQLSTPNIIDDGLQMEIEIMPSFELIKQKGYTKTEIPVVRTMALFDTGAKTCAVDKSIIESLKVTSHMVSKVKTPFHIIESPVYQLIYKIPEKEEYFPITAVVVDLSDDNHKAIIGRDFLQYCNLVYDGINKTGYLFIIK